jgi:hypothetical protein
VQQGPVESGEHVAISFIDALKSQPATLALIVANVTLLGFLFYALSGAAKFRQDMLTAQYEYQRHVTELLSRCVVPPRQGSIEEPRKFALPATGEPPKAYQGASEPERRLLNGEP